jgi:hypothetical protein
VPHFALGAQIVGGWGFVRDPAWGPAVFVEHRPARAAYGFALRLTVLTMTNDARSSDTSIDIAVRRTAARIGASLQLPKTPFAFVSGLEAGWMSARGSGAIVPQEGRSGWGAWFGGILLDFPLIHHRLSLEAGADAAVSPFGYAFRTSSERTIIDSSRVELRTTAGLKSSF